MNVCKICQGSNIPTKIMKLIIDLFGNFICQHFNSCISIGEFPNEINHADVTPVHKKKINMINLSASEYSFKHFNNLWENYLQSTLWILQRESFS